MNKYFCKLNWSYICFQFFTLTVNPSVPNNQNMVVVPSSKWFRKFNNLRSCDLPERLMRFGFWITKYIFDVEEMFYCCQIVIYFIGSMLHFTIWSERKKHQIKEYVIFTDKNVMYWNEWCRTNFLHRDCPSFRSPGKTVSWNAFPAKLVNIMKCIIINHDFTYLHGSYPIVVFWFVDGV